MKNARRIFLCAVFAAFIVISDARPAPGSAPAAAPAAGTWFPPEEVVREVSYSDVADRRSAIDSQGRLHLATFGQDFIYWLKDSSGWHRQYLDSDLMNYGALALDAQDRPHIAYLRSDPPTVVYTAQTGSAWQPQVVGEAYGGVSLALDPAGSAHLFYLKDPYTNQFMYAQQAGGAWHPVQVPISSESRGFSLAVDPAGQVHLAIVASAADGVDRLLYYTKFEDIWDYEVVDESGAAGHLKSPSLAIDSRGEAHIAYMSDAGSGYHIQYAHFHNGWQRHEFTGGLGYHPSLRLDAAGSPAIGFSGKNWEGLLSSGIYLAKKAAGAWQVSRLYSFSTLTYDFPVTLALGPAGQAALAYYRSGELAALTPSGASWQREVIGAETTIWQLLGFALDPEDQPRLFYQVNETLVAQAHRQAGAWQYGPDASLDVNGGAALRLDAAGRPCLSFYGGDLRLKYACQDNAAWDLAAIETQAASEHGRGSVSLAWDSAGRPHISYNIQPANFWDGGDLRLARFNGAQWVTQTVDSRPNSAGQYSSLALDGRDQPHISYSQASPAELLYAARDGAAWRTETISSTGRSECRSAVAVGAEGQPRAAFFRTTPAGWALIYAARSSQGWAFQTVEQGSGGLDSDEVALALDAAQQPHLAYVTGAAAGKYFIHYAFRAGQTWQVEPVNASGFDFFPEAVLALDRLGAPHIAYRQKEPPGRIQYTRRFRYGAVLQPDSAASSNLPGKTAVFNLQVVNQGDSADTLQLQASGNRWTVQPASLEVGPLDPGETAPFQAAVFIPKTASLGAVDVVTYTAYSLAGGGQNIAGRLATTAGPPPLYRTFLPLLRASP